MKIERKRFNKVLALGWILTALFIFFLALRETNLLIKLIGLIGSSIVAIIEVIFFIKKW